MIKYWSLVSAMETEKSEVLRDCKNLLRLVNCEAVIDTKDETLYDILFKSHAKKKMLLSWLIQQIYSAECCAHNSFEDLISIFISKQHLQNFLLGKIPMLDQYKRWKLIMNVLHQRQKRKICPLFIDVDKEIESGTLLEKYENIWNEKLGSGFNYVGLVSAKETKLKSDELQSLLEAVKYDNAQLSSSSASQLFVPDDDAFSSDSQIALLETFRNSDKKLNQIIKENYDYDCLKPNVSAVDQLEMGPKYQQLNRKMLSDTKTQLEALRENIGIFSKLMHGVENFQF